MAMGDDMPPWAGFRGSEAATDGANVDDGLLGALVSTFSVIIMGYIIGKMEWLPPPSTGMAQFMSRIALPSVVFSAMMTIEFDTLNWSLVLGLALSRTAVFVITVLGCLAANRGNKLAAAKAGIRGIFVTQSNDFALGLPLLSSLYPTELTRYIYIAAPISFLWINPMGFALLEMGTRRAGRNAAMGPPPSGCKLAWNIFKGVIGNPIVFMTFFGLIFNFIFKAMPPSVMLMPFEMLSKTFGGLALTALGMSMANKLFFLKGQALLSACCLIFAKTIMLPLIAKVMVSGLAPEDVYIAADNSPFNCTNAEDVKMYPNDCQAYDLSVFAFVMSTFPTAPGVLAFALQYGVDATEMAAGAVLCTVVSAPLMFVTAKMAFIREIEEVGNATGVQETVDNVAQVFNIASNFGCVLIIGMYTIRKRYKYNLDVTVMMLALAMLTFNIASSVCNVGVSDSVAADVRSGIIQYAWLAICFWVIIYVTLLETLQAKGRTYAITRFVVKYKQLIGWGMPGVLTGIMFGINRSPESRNGVTCWFRGISNAHPEMWITNLAVVLITFVTLLFSSIKIQRRAREHKDHTTAVQQQGGHNEDGSDSDEALLVPGAEAIEEGKITPAPPSYSDRSMQSQGQKDSFPKLSTENTSLLMGAGGGSASSGAGFDGSGGGGGGGGGGSGGIRDGWENVHGSTGFPQVATRRGDFTNYLLPSELRHTVFITYELCCMLLALVDPTLAVARNSTTVRSGPIIELNFADVALSSAQGIMLFLCFGVEDALWLPVTAAANRVAASFRKLLYSTESEELARIRQWQAVHGDLSQVQHHCNTIRGMKDVCMDELARTRRYHLRTYKDVFTGAEMIDFLLEKNLVEDRYGGLDFGRDLLIGDVIVHVSHEHHFHDCDFFYRFCTDKDYVKKNRSESMSAGTAAGAAGTGGTSPTRSRKSSTMVSVQG